MPGETANLSLPFILASQAEKHATLNESLIALDQLVQARVLTRSLTTEPLMPVEGQSWILPATSSGLRWQGFAANALARLCRRSVALHIPKSWLASLCNR